jgi:hypothetical protein
MVNSNAQKAKPFCTLELIAEPQTEIMTINQ